MKTCGLTLFILFTLCACGEANWMASGALDGVEAPPPERWDAMVSEEIIQLETNPADPYSVNLWVVAMDNELYVHAGANRANWVEHIEKEPSVRVGNEGTIYPLFAQRVTSAEEFARFAAVYEEKYGNPPRNMNVDEAYLIRLTRSPPAR